MAGPRPVRPMNVEQIVQKAESFEYNPLVPFRHWARSAGTLLKEVSTPPVTAYLRLISGSRQKSTKVKATNSKPIFFSFGTPA